MPQLDKQFALVRDGKLWVEPAEGCQGVYVRISGEQVLEHGDEPAGPLAALELLKHGAFDHGPWRLCPALNPTGLAAGTVLLTSLGVALIGRAATADALKAFWRREYVPGQTTLMVVGDVDPAQLAMLTTRYFGEWKGNGVKGPEAFDAVPFLQLLNEHGAPWAMEDRPL